MRSNEKTALEKFNQIFDVLFNDDSVNYQRLIALLLESLSEILPSRSLLYVHGNKMYDWSTQYKLKEVINVENNREEKYSEKIPVIEKDSEKLEHYLLFNLQRVKNKDYQESFNLLIHIYRSVIKHYSEQSFQERKENTSVNKYYQDNLLFLKSNIRQLEEKNIKLQKEVLFLNQNFRIQKSTNWSKSVFYQEYMENLWSEFKVASGMLYIEPDEAGMRDQWQKKVQAHLSHLLHRNAEEINLIQDTIKIIDKVISPDFDALNVSDAVNHSVTRLNDYFSLQTVKWELSKRSEKLVIKGDLILLERAITALFCYFLLSINNSDTHKNKPVFTVNIKEYGENIILLSIHTQNLGVTTKFHQEILSTVQEYDFPHPTYGKRSVYLAFVVEVLKQHKSRIEFLEQDNTDICLVYLNKD